MTGTPAQDAAFEYVSLGLSVIPLRPHSKKPLESWAQYQRHVADAATIHGWFDHEPDAGVGIIAGDISHDLAVLDVDDPDFSRWLLSRADGVLHRTWCVLTGSGKLHIYLHSQTPCYSTILAPTNGNGRLADIRGSGSGTHGGSYVVAPPSLHPDSGQPYRTYCGEPRHIATVSDAQAFFEALRDGYNQRDGGSTGGVTGGPGPLPSLPLDDADDLARRIAAAPLTGKVKRAITQGGKPGEGEWAGSNIHSYSEIDYAVLAALNEDGWSAEEMEAIFATFAIGAGCYRDTRRSNHGRSYFAQTLGNVRGKRRAQDEAGSAALGRNFRVVAVRKIPYEDPIYELSVEGPHGVTAKAAYTYDELMSERRFLTRLGSVIDDWPELDSAYTGKQFARWAGLLLRMAVEEEIPETARNSGHLRALILQILRQQSMLSLSLPDGPNDFYLGWIDEAAQTIHLRSGILIRRLAAEVHPAPAPQVVWSTLRNLGGGNRSHRWPSNQNEDMWTLPLRILAL